MTDELRAIVAHFKSIEEAHEIVRTVEIAIGGGTYRLEICENNSELTLEPDPLPFRVRCYVKVPSRAPDVAYAWAGEEIPLKYYPDVDVALRSVLQILTDKDGRPGHSTA